VVDAGVEAVDGSCGRRGTGFSSLSHPPSAFTLTITITTTALTHTLSHKTEVKNYCANLFGAGAGGNGGGGGVAAECIVDGKCAVLTVLLPGNVAGGWIVGGGGGVWCRWWEWSCGGSPIPSPCAVSVCCSDSGGVSTSSNSNPLPQQCLNSPAQ